MRRALVVAIVALAAVALYAATAPAGQQLTKRVKTLEKKTKDLEGFAGAVVLCVFDKGAVATTKAPQYHVTAPGEATDFYVLTTNNQECVNFINSPLARRVLRAAGH